MQFGTYAFNTVVRWKPEGVYTQWCVNKSLVSRDCVHETHGYPKEFVLDYLVRFKESF